MAFAIAGSTALAIGVTAAGVGAAAGGISALSANKERKASEARLDQMANQSPLYQGSKPISEYYQQALNRYNENPYQSQQYLTGKKNIERAGAAGVSALQDRRAGVGSIGRIVQSQADALGSLGGQAEAQKSQRFGELGQATQLKNADIQQQFDINKMTPYNRKFGLAQYKAQAANERYNNAVAQTFNSLGNMASLGMSAGTGKTGGGAPAMGPSSKDIVEGWSTNPSSRPQINPDLIPKFRG